MQYRKCRSGRAVSCLLLPLLLLLPVLEPARGEKIDAGPAGGFPPADTYKVDLQDLTPEEMQDIHDELLNSTGLGNLTGADGNDTLVAVLDDGGDGDPENAEDNAIKDAFNETNVEIPLKGTQGANGTVQLDALAPEAAPAPPDSPPDSPPSPGIPPPEPPPNPDPEPPSPEPTPPPEPEAQSPPPPPEVLPPPPPPPALTPQQNALMQFKGSLVNGNTVLESWREGTNECQDWKGVGCSNEVVTSLSLGGLGLEGQISADIASLEGLQKIDMSNNRLSGSIPNSFNFPNALPRLAELNVAGNQLNGGPADWGFSGSLAMKSVDFSNNVLGFFPKWSFKELKFINVANNDLGGVIPTYFAAVVPASEPVVILPQRAVLCGTLPEGPRWAEQEQSGSYRAITSLPPNAACGQIPPPPAPFPPPGVQPSPPPPPPPSSSSSGGLSTGAIIGIAVGGSIGLILLVGLFFVLCRPKQTVRIGGDRDRAGGVSSQRAQRHHAPDLCHLLSPTTINRPVSVPLAHKRALTPSAHDKHDRPTTMDTTATTTSST